MREFARHGVEAGYFVPTKTGLEKSIIDAHESLRNFFRSKGIHDFGRQDKGTENKVVVDVDLVHRDRFELRTISFYRPETKQGDPRFWVSRLGDFASPGNLLAFFVSASGRLTLVNCSDASVWPSEAGTGGVLGVGGQHHSPTTAQRHPGGRTASTGEALSPRVATPLTEALAMPAASAAADELLKKLRDICRLGFIRSLRDGPTGVGYTLETHLGIRANSSRSPDFRGIEIKSGRIKAAGRSETRTTLFSKTPDWAASSLPNGGAILDAHGYRDAGTGRLQLYCTLSNSPNTQGLYLRTGPAAPTLGMFTEAGGPRLVWPLDELESALSAKHRETFWVSARRRESSDGTEEFQYEKVIHTRSPLASNLGPLIDAGKIEMDLTLSRKPSGGTRDHGYLFKIWQRDIELLFPPPTTYLLMA